MKRSGNETAREDLYKMSKVNLVLNSDEVLSIIIIYVLLNIIRSVILIVYLQQKKTINLHFMKEKN